MSLRYALKKENNSYSSLNGLPSDGKPEIVFVGRSNIKTFSLLNLLCARKGLAKTSSTPGKTRLVAQQDFVG